MKNVQQRELIALLGRARAKQGMFEEFNRGRTGSGQIAE
jgi:hypothetical protein